MKRIFLTIFIFLLAISQTFAASTFEGGVSAEGRGMSSRIVDRATGNGISGVKISLPKQNYSTKTDSDGYFELDTHINGTSILSVQKDNYKPYSVTVTDQTISAPIVIGIEKSNKSDLVVDSNMYHLGDNNFSDLSANAGEFKMQAIGPF